MEALCVKLTVERLSSKITTLKLNLGSFITFNLTFLTRTSMTQLVFFFKRNIIHNHSLHVPWHTKRFQCDLKKNLILRFSSEKLASTFQLNLQIVDTSKSSRLRLLL